MGLRQSVISIVSVIVIMVVSWEWVFVFWFIVFCEKFFVVGIVLKNVLMVFVVLVVMSFWLLLICGFVVMWRLCVIVVDLRNVIMVIVRVLGMRVVVCVRFGMVGMGSLFGIVEMRLILRVLMLVSYIRRMFLIIIMSVLGIFGVKCLSRRSMMIDLVESSMVGLFILFRDCLIVVMDCRKLCLEKLNVLLRSFGS